MGSPSCDSWIDSIESVDSRIDPLAEIMSDRGFATGSKRLMGSVEKLLKLCYEADQEAPGGIQPKSTDPYRNVSTDEECDCDPRQFSRITLCTSRWPKCSAGLDIVSPLQRLEAAARGAAKRLEDVKPPEVWMWNQFALGCLESLGRDDAFLKEAYDLAWELRDVKARLATAMAPFERFVHQYSRRVSRYRCLAWAMTQIIDDCVSLIKLSCMRLNECGRPLPAESPGNPTPTASPWSPSSRRNMEIVGELAVCWKLLSEMTRRYRESEIRGERPEAYKMAEAVFSHILFASATLDAMTGGAYVEERSRFQHFMVKRDYFHCLQPHGGATRVPSCIYEGAEGDLIDIVSNMKVLIDREMLGLRRCLETYMLRLVSRLSADTSRSASPSCDSESEESDNE